jgi:hypothetical protein
VIGSRVSFVAATVDSGRDEVCGREVVGAAGARSVVDRCVRAAGRAVFSGATALTGSRLSVAGLADVSASGFGVAAGEETTASVSATAVSASAGLTAAVLSGAGVEAAARGSFTTFWRTDKYAPPAAAATHPAARAPIARDFESITLS